MDTNARLAVNCSSDCVTHSNKSMPDAKPCADASRTRSTIISEGSSTSLEPCKRVAPPVRCSCGAIGLSICIDVSSRRLCALWKTQSDILLKLKEYCACSDRKPHYAADTASRLTSAEKSSAQSQQSSRR